MPPPPQKEGVSTAGDPPGPIVKKIPAPMAPGMLKNVPWLGLNFFETPCLGFLTFTAFFPRIFFMFWTHPKNHVFLTFFFPGRHQHFFSPSEPLLTRKTLFFWSSLKRFNGVLPPPFSGIFTFCLKNENLKSEQYRKVKKKGVTIPCQ